MCLKTKYNLVIDGRNLLPSDRGISTFLINLINKNDNFIKKNVLVFINKSSEKIAQLNQLNYQIIHNNYLISDAQISFFSFRNDVKKFVSPANILPIFPILSRSKILVVHDISFLYPKHIFGHRNNRQVIGAFLRKYLVPFSIKRADIIITVSNFAKNEIYRYMKIKNNINIHIIYHGFTVNKKVPTLNKGKELSFIAVLGEAGQKNINNLIEAFKIINKLFSCKLKLIGVTKSYLISNKIELNY